MRFKLAFGVVALCAIAAQLPAVEPDFAKIADLLEQIADELRAPAEQPQKQPPAPPTPRQLPILTDQRLDALGKLRAAKSPDWLALKSAADRTGTANPVYDDDGQFAALVYRVTGDKSYAAKAWAALYKDVSGDIGPVDNVREYFVEYLLVYAWIRDSLSDAQQRQFAAAIQRWADVSLGNGPAEKRGGFQFSDSDQTIGQYFGLALMDALQIGPGGLLDREIANGGAQGRRVGGLDATAADRTTARNTIRQYVEQLAAGGEWFESRQYNSNTVVLLLMGWMALADTLGEDHFPEIAAWVPGACQAALVSFTPDRQSAVEWGDDERAGSLDLYKQIPFLAALEAAALRVGDRESAAKVASLLSKLRTAQGDKGIRGRAYYFLGDSISPQPYLNAAAPLSNYSPGVGMLRRIDRDRLFFAFAPSRLRVDHECNFIADLMLYSKGEWVLRHPIAYSVVTDSAAGVNAVLVSGCSAMLAKGPLACENTPDYAYFVGQTQGMIYEKTAWNSPPEWLHELTRSVLYLPQAGAICVCDRINADDPLAARPDLVGYLRPDKEAILAARHRKEIVWHMPVKPAVSATSLAWASVGGQRLQIDAFSPTGALAVKLFDEHELWSDVSSIPADQKAWQARMHPDADRKWDAILTLIRLSPGADAPQPISQGKLAGWRFGETTVLFGVDQSSRLIEADGYKPSGRTYLVGCQERPVTVLP